MTQAVHRAVQLIEPCELLGVVKFRRRSTEFLRDLDRKLDRGRNVDLVACAGCRTRYHRFGRDRHADDRRVGCDRGLQYAVDVIDVVAVGGNVLHGDRERDGRTSGRRLHDAHEIVRHAQNVAFLHGRRDCKSSVVEDAIALSRVDGEDRIHLGKDFARVHFLHAHRRDHEFDWLVGAGGRVRADVG